MLFPTVRGPERNTNSDFRRNLPYPRFPDRTGIGSEDIKDPDNQERENGREADESGRPSGFLGERRGRLKATQRQYGENHSREDTSEMMRRLRGL